MTTTAAATTREERLTRVIAGAVPAGLVLALSLRSGGYPPGIPATVAAVLMLLLAARFALAPAGVRRPSGAGMLIAVALAALTGLSLASMLWSHAPARAVTSAGRDLLYLMTLLTVATLPRSTLPTVERSLLVGIGAVGVIALAPRLFPDVLPLSADASSQRLAWPLSYQNALGILMATGLLLALHLCSDRSQPRRWALGAAAAVPVMLVALYLTQSRGAIAAAVIGVVAWLLLARSRWALAGSAVVALPSLVALVATYSAVELIAATPSPAVAGEGHRVAVVLIICAVAAAWARGRAGRFERRIRDAPLPALGAPLVAVAVVIVCGIAVLAAGGRVAAALHQFGNVGPSVTTGDPRTRLVQFTGSGRLELWRGAADVFRAHPLLGRGADTFQTSWDRVRPDAAESTEAHSLYLEALAELGIPGLLLVVAVLVGVLLALVRHGVRRPSRAVGAAILLAWAVHAAVDWDWEMPALTLVAVVLLARLAAEAEPDLSRRRAAAPAGRRPAARPAT